MTSSQKFDAFLNESPIAFLQDTISYDIRIDTTTHAEERKFRHSWLEPITNEQIVETVEKALKTIARNQLMGLDEIGQKYWIREKAKNLNVIGQLTNQKGRLVFIIVTVMQKDKFIGNPDAVKIDV